MDAAAVRNSKDKKFRPDKRCRVLAAGLLLVLLILSRYIVNGEPVDVRSDETEIGVELSLYDGMEIRQPLTFTEEMNWRQGYYALYFATCDTSSEGHVTVTVEQGEMLQTDTIALRDIRSGEWMPLDGIDPGKAVCGEAVLRLYTEGVARGELAAAAGQDYYGFGVVDYNGVTQGLALAQAYHYHITGMEYGIRLLCYGIVMLCMVVLLAVVSSKTAESRGQCLTVFGIMTVMFMAVIYLLDSSIYLEPTYAEAVTNFLKYAREENFVNNFFITDAGYLPLLPRLIALLYIKVLRLPSAYALYFMQATACLLCSMIWAFFALYPFHGIMKLPDRILWCILVMMSCFCEETLFFTNHAYWGIYFILLMMIADLQEFHGWVYAGLTGFGALLCLSKGTYAVVLPLAVLCLVLMYRSMTGRDRIFLFAAGASSLLQVLYAFGGQGDGDSWIAAASGGWIDFLLRMLIRVFVEFSAYLLLPLGKYVQRIPVVILVLTLALVGFLAVDFVRNILLPFIQGKTVSKARRNFYIAVLYQLIVSAFYLVTVKPVPESWGSIGRVAFGQMGHKYEIFSDIGFYMLLLTGSIMLQSKDGLAETAGTDDIRPKHGIMKTCSRYAVLVLMGVFCLTNPVMQLTGWAEAETSDGRVYAGNINAGWWSCKDWLQNSAFFIPTRGDNWSYSRNATLYQVGTDAYFEETSCVNLEEEISGYHSFYEIQEETKAQNLIGVMIRRPDRMKTTDYTVRLLDADNNVIAQTEQTGNGRYKKCLFYFADPVSHAKRIQFVDTNGEPVYYKDYIAWVCAW